MSCGADAVASCPSCATENPPGAKFCIECGTAPRGRWLGRGGARPGLGAPAAPAPGCGARPPASAQRGGLFGGQLPGVGAPAWGSPAAGALPEERRKATVLFADLSGYTAVAERMDPEAVKSMVDRALRRLGQEVVRYGGTVDKYIGDNVMAVFGAPVAHEDDPERAVRAGLAMQAAMEEINQRDRAPRAGRQLLAAGRDQLRRGARRPGRRRLHGDRRRGQRRGAAAGGGATGKRHRRRDHPPPDPRRDRVRRARAADAEGQVRAGAGLGGGPRAGPGPATRGARAGGAADRPRGRVGAAAVAVRAGGAREPPAPGHRHRPGRGRQVAPAARAGGADRRARRRSRPSGSAAAPPTAPGSPTGRSARSSAASSRSSTPTTPSWPGRSSCSGIEAVVSDAETDEPPERIAATIARPLGIEPPAEHATATGVHDAEDPQQMRDRLFSAVRSLVEAASRQRPAGDRDRGHPLGRRGDARPDRVPGALGARARR